MSRADLASPGDTPLLHPPSSFDLTTGLLITAFPFTVMSAPPGDETLRLCLRCHGIPPESPDMAIFGYSLAPSLKALKTSASGENYCTLCQMLWESLITKRFRTQVGKSRDDPLLAQQWEVKIYAFVGADDGERASLFKGYEGLELRCGDRSSSNDCTWSITPRDSKKQMYPVVSRIYVRCIGESGHKQWIYTTSPLNDESAVVTDTIRTWYKQCSTHHGHLPDAQAAAQPGAHHRCGAP
jgi:hypothetical protein